MNKTRKLYFANLEIAQDYALAEARYRGTPQTAFVVFPIGRVTREDLGLPRFIDSFEPLIPSGLDRLEVELMAPIVVTKENEVGLLANLRRAYESRFSPVASK